MKKKKKTPITEQEAARVMGLPQKWPSWPYLPLTRGRQVGVMIDFFHWKNWEITGYGATAFLVPFFMLPDTPAETVELPKEVFDTVEEMIESGWRPVV
jgi:hypothetical protein